MTNAKLVPDPPGRPWDYVVVSTIGLASIPFILGNVILVLNRDYRPLRTKNVNLTVLSSVGGLVWIGSTIVVNRHFSREQHTVWSVCSLWTFWFQACFGFSLWLNCLNVHLILLYRIFIRKSGGGRLMFNILSLLCLQMPTIIVCICASAVRAIRFETPESDCKLKKGWPVGLTLLFFLDYVVFVGLAFKLRNKVMAQYNEFRLIRYGGVMSLFWVLLFVVTMQTHANDKVAGRCFVSLCVSFAVFYYFWGRNGEVIYNWIFHKEAYLQRFREEVMNEMDRVISERDSPHNMPSSVSVLDIESVDILELIKQYQTQAERLQEELLTVQRRLSSLQQQVSMNNSTHFRRVKMESILVT